MDEDEATYKGIFRGLESPRRKPNIPPVMARDFSSEIWRVVLVKQLKEEKVPMKRVRTEVANKARFEAMTTTSLVTFSAFKKSHTPKNVPKQSPIIAPLVAPKTA